MIDPEYTSPSELWTHITSIYNFFKFIVLSKGFLRTLTYAGFGLTVWNIIHPSSVNRFNSTIKSYHLNIRTIRNTNKQGLSMPRSFFREEFFKHLGITFASFLGSTLYFYTVLLNIQAQSVEDRSWLSKAFDLFYDIPLLSIFGLPITFLFFRSYIQTVVNLLFWIDSKSAIGAIGAIIGILSFTIGEFFL